MLRNAPLRLPRSLSRSISRETVALSIALALFGASAFAQEQDEYRLRARLDPSTHTVHGRAQITWTNRSSVPLDELLFHLYLNAFENDGTVFMRESEGQLRGQRFHGEGSIEVEYLRVDGADRLEGSDDELIDGDRTQLRVPLTEPIPAGSAVQIDIGFQSHLPPGFARSGYHGDFHVVAQWFPKLAKLEADGSFASFPYHGAGEFYADFARYELNVEVPSGWVVGATGEEVSAGDGRTFVAVPVHDCAFVAAPWFEEQHREVTLASGQTVDIHILYPPGFDSAVERHLDVTAAGLLHYGRLYGDYPYPTLTIAVPPRGASGIGGMEYPSLFVTDGPWVSLPWLPITAQDEVTAHELGHQWFQGLVATNEVEWPMLDEGLTEWSTGELLRELHGRRGSGLRVAGFDIDGFELRRVGAWARYAPPPGTPAHRFETFSQYGASVYARTSSIVETIARTWGRSRTTRALGRYARQQRFQHPGPDALFDAFDEEFGPWMSQRVLRPALMEGAVSATLVQSVEGNRFRVHRAGGLPIPTWIEVRSAAGIERIRFPGTQRTLEAEVSAPIDALRVDPDRNNLTDGRRVDDIVGAWSANDPIALVSALLAWVGP